LVASYPIALGAAEQWHWDIRYRRSSGSSWAGALGPIQTKLPLFIVLYGIFLTLGEVGPGSTIVLTASESFPTAVRGHAVGLAAAFSKAGAAIGTQVFKPILASWGSDETRGTQAVFLIGSGFAVLGALLAWFVLQDSDKILDHGDQEWKDYLAAHGYEHIEWGVEDTSSPEEVKNLE
jgi:nitrate/nitrite transporter NarK